MLRVHAWASEGGRLTVATLRRMLTGGLTIWAVALALWAAALAAAAALPPAPDPLRDRMQMLVVTTAGWNAVDGSLQRYERSHAGASWRPVGAAVAIVVGKSGMGWGSGLMSVPSSLLGPDSGPAKHEGDGRSPAGAFALGTGFGYAAAAPPGWKLSYMSLTPTIECVDDSSSRFYNRLVDRATVSPDWNSSEHMASTGEYYRWGAVVDHNVDPAVPGRGSCIFLHVWGGVGQGTTGCTAMAQPQLEPILAWLDPRARPVLVQLPATAYAKLRKPWRLPKPTPAPPGQP
jgi:hypothetical protein